jgi:hypothetical protein
MRSATPCNFVSAFLFIGATWDYVLEACCDELERVIDRLNYMSFHDVLIMLHSSFSAPEIQNLLLCLPGVDHWFLSTFTALTCSEERSIGIAKVCSQN